MCQRDFGAAVANRLSVQCAISVSRPVPLAYFCVTGRFVLHLVGIDFYFALFSVRVCVIYVHLYTRSIALPSLWFFSLIEMIEDRMIPLLHKSKDFS